MGCSILPSIFNHQKRTDNSLNHLRLFVCSLGANVEFPLDNIQFMTSILLPPHLLAVVCPLLVLWHSDTTTDLAQPWLCDKIVYIQWLCVRASKWYTDSRQSLCRPPSWYTLIIQSCRNRARNKPYRSLNKFLLTWDFVFCFVWGEATAQTPKKRPTED